MISMASGSEHPREQAGGGLRLAELRLAHTADRHISHPGERLPRAVAETTDEQAAQLAVQAAGACLAWAERFRRRPGWPRHRAALARARARCGAARSTRSGPAVHLGQN
jgi:hypothetical protein